MSVPLRFITYLAAATGQPGLQASMFEAVAHAVGRVLQVPVSMRVGDCGSGPGPSDDDVFARDEADVGFVCAPSMLWLVSQGSVDLVPAAMVLHEPRAPGRPEYFCEVVVREDHPATDFEALAGGTAAYNDRASLSGWGSLLHRLESVGGLGFLQRALATGSHAASMRAVADGNADFAVIDANVWRARGEAFLGLRVLETLGPYPVQPTVIRRGLSNPTARGLARALMQVGGEGLGPLQGFAAVRYEDYATGVPAVCRLASRGA